MALQVCERECAHVLLSLVAHAVGCKTVIGAHNTVYVRRVWQALPCSSGMANDDAHNTVRQIPTPTTLFGFWHAWKVIKHPSGMAWRYCPVGVQGTVLGIAVDLSALPFLLRLILGSSSSGRPRSVVPSRLRPRRSEKSCKQRFDVFPVGKAG
jgi:hypothetical protein